MEKTVGPVAEPSTHAILSTRYTASVIGEAAVIHPDTGITTDRPPETIASAAHAESTGLVLNEPQIVTMLPASMSSSEPVAEAPELSESKTAVTAEAPQPRIPTIVAMNASTPKLDPASTIKTAEDAAAPDAMLDEKISQVEPASSPVSLKTERETSDCPG
jgi:hypothetical protein